MITSKLYGKMSQEERIAQLKSMYMDDLFSDEGQLDTAKCRELIPYGIGHFSQFCMQQPRDPNVLRDRAAAIQDWLIHNTPNGIPALLHEEVLSGVNTKLPPADRSGLFIQYGTGRTEDATDEYGSSQDGRHTRPLTDGRRVS